MYIQLRCKETLTAVQYDSTNFDSVLELCQTSNHFIKLVEDKTRGCLILNHRDFDGVEQSEIAPGEYLIKYFGGVHGLLGVVTEDYLQEVYLIV